MSRDIASGLPWLARRPDDFAGFRASVRRSLGQHDALEAWTGDEADLLTMLGDLWAATCDRLALYDEVLANECYLRTAQRQASVTSLVAPLGYRPRPAIAAELALALTATGAAAVSVPAGSGFIASVPGAGAQRFETDANVSASNTANRSPLQPAAALYLAGLSGGSISSLLLAGGTRQPVLPARLVVYLPGDATPWRLISVASVQPAVDASGASAWRVNFAAPLTVGPAVVLADVRVLRPTQRAALWRVSGSSSAPISGAQVLLDGIHRRITADETVILERGSSLGVYRVSSLDETAALLPAPAAATVSTSGVSYTIQAGAMPMGVTRLTLSQLSGDNALVAAIVSGGDVGAVWHGLLTVGRVVAANPDPSAWLLESGFARAVSGTGGAATVLLADALGAGGEVAGTISDTRFAPAASITVPAAPVVAYGNLVRASRGTLVRGERLGSGDASRTNQRFRLAQQPLTYRRDPASAAGVRPELVLRVDGEAWSAVATFYGRRAHERIFVIEHDAKGDAWLVFGDGLRGSLLPTGNGNVTADYRHGAGAAAPTPGLALQPAGAPAGIAGARCIGQPTAGADGEDASETRLQAPRSALVLGRAVSARDVEALALSESGVYAAHADWQWDARRQRVVVAVTYAGAASLVPWLTERLRARLDPEAAVVVTPAVEVTLHLVCGVTCDPGRSLPVVRAAVESALTSATGPLSPTMLGIGQPLWRSRLAAAVGGVAGVQSLSALAASVASGAALAFDAAQIGPGIGARFVPTLDVTVTEATHA